MNADRIDWNEYIRIPYQANGRTREGSDCYGWLRIVIQAEREIELPSWSDEYDDAISAARALKQHIDRGVDGHHWESVNKGEEQTLDGAIIWDRRPNSMVHVALVARPGTLIMMLNHRGALAQPYNGSDIVSRFWRDRIVEFRRLV